jgi:hypothetical protein
MDIITLSKGLNTDIEKLNQEEVEIKKRITEYKKLVQSKKEKQKVVDELLAEEKALLAELNN